MDNFNYSVKDMILIILGIDEDFPMKKKVVIREAFLFEKELFNKTDLIFESCEFKAGKFGPESEVIDSEINKMNRLITDYRGKLYLTEKGKIKARNLIDKIDDDFIRKIRHKKDGLDQWGVQTLLKKISRDYPEYTSD